MPISRRHALFALGSTSAIPAFGGSKPAPSTGIRFDHGVASGDPLVDRVILWTRVSGLTKATEVMWQVATDDSFARPVAQGRFTTDAERDYTVKIDAAGLKPGTDYVYRFTCKGVTSPTGRTRTLPEQATDVVLAVASCSLYPNGYFNAYGAIADMDRLDAVVHLGDYIYEYGAAPDDYGMGNGRTLGRAPQPVYEIVSLSDYRTRHAQYKADPDLQAAHARAPWICVFDDHEITNNPWTDGAQNHNAGEGDWWARKAAALRAYREWMPIRDAGPGQLAETIYRSFRFGQVAELVMMETRLLARTKQLEFEDIRIIDGKPDYAGFRARLNDPKRELLGATQSQWLGDTLKASTAAGVRWQILGSQMIMARAPGPDLIGLMGQDRVAALLAALPEGLRTRVGVMAGLFTKDIALPLNLDAWDGYPAERERLYDLIKAAGARTIVVSGDSHTAWANELNDAAGKRTAVEFGVTSVTSPTRYLDSWLPDLQLAATMAKQNPEIVAADDGHNGFLRLRLTAEGATGEWMGVSTITSRDFSSNAVQRFDVVETNGALGLVTV
ncbi:MULTISPECIES: alkaline phosphatase [Asticcacaulis]|uniref:alkaline phosphatase D family protein n=1 Tax=Asticcacaulis TaxID=76890 RepID=UPI001AE611FF|nr:MULTISPECIES: alkaline phosphatase D family protein [Asticcacaulis]MBP2157741.1 alkaline phosphatase D [Asticcacaulis solisilvae]MDR6798786.1 alkaline phosphatase D [Asticcacaulis sp. BE141]